MIRKFITLALLCSGLAVAACNTVEGVGEDVSSAGDAVQDAAE
jgi:predicted small secreted protein